VFTTPVPVAPPSSGGGGGGGVVIGGNWKNCGSTPGYALVDCVRSAVNPTGNGDLAFEVTKRVAWALRSEGAGLLSKPSGNNCQGYAVDIVVYPNGVHYDMVGDGGGANIPQWLLVIDPATGGPLLVDPARWRAPLDPGDSSPAPNDFDGDGSSDLFVRNYVTGENQIIYLRGSSVVGSQPVAGISEVTWRAVSTPDINGDGYPDVIWRNATTGQNVVWFMRNSAVIGSAQLPTVADMNWQLAGTADFDLDGHVDFVWRNAVTGQNVIWS
jgi:hypothetical protein